MENTYVCANCGQEKEKGWSDEEAAAEAAELFPGIEIEDCDLVCDECFKAFQEWQRKTRPVS